VLLAIRVRYFEWRKNVHIPHILRPFVVRLFCFTAPYQYKTLLNFRRFIFSITPFGWPRFITLAPTNAIISYGNIIFYLHFFYLPHFQEHNYGVKRGLVVVKIERRPGDRPQYFLHDQLQFYEVSRTKVPQQII
jgi:hypothetical protein